MDLAGKLILAFLEEDNPQRGFFHVRPLLTEDGPVAQSSIDYFKDEGYIRVVPDKNEQYTFKDRMRQLGCTCFINLRDFPVDANKIRTNRNYAPMRGEMHQFIIYSDAVQSIAGSPVYEVLAGQEGMPAPAATPWCFLREGGRISGPFNAYDGTPAGDAVITLRPDSDRLFCALMPTGEERLFYWPKEEKNVVAEAAAPAPETAVQNEETPEALTPGEASAQDLIRMMDEELSDLPNSIREETAFRLAPKEEPQFRSSGTPIFRTAALQPAPRRAHNQLNAVVGRFARDARMEAPGAMMAANAGMQAVANPVDAFKRAADEVWRAPGTQGQAVDYFLALSGAQSALRRALDKGDGRIVLDVMRSQLEDMEAERLSLVMQIDRAEEKKEALLQEALTRANEKETAKLDSLKKENQVAEEALEALRLQQQTLLEERASLIADLEKVGGIPRLLAPEMGEETLPRDLVDRILRHLQAAGAPAEPNDARHLMLLLTLFPQVQLSSLTKSDALEIGKALAAAMGAATTVLDNAQDEPVYLAGGQGPAFAFVKEGSSSDAPYTRVIAADGICPKGDSYPMAPWPCAFLEAKRFPAPVRPPVDDAVLPAFIVEKLSENMPAEMTLEATELLVRLRRDLKEMGAPIPAKVLGDLQRYLLFAARLMDGGLAAAVDYGVSSFILPHLKYYNVSADMLRHYFAGMERTLVFL